ncbi:26839_t:CDS:2, partial [Gigaspora margarita]
MLIILQHHDLLTEEKITLIFNHPSVLASNAQGLQYQVFMWIYMLCAPWGGEHGLDDNGNTTSIPILLDHIGKPGPQQKKDCLSAIINSSINNIETNPNIQAFESNDYDNIELNNKNNIESNDHDNIKLNDYDNLESNDQDNEKL